MPAETFNTSGESTTNLRRSSDLFNHKPGFLFLNGRESIKASWIADMSVAVDTPIIKTPLIASIGPNSRLRADMTISP